LSKQWMSNCVTGIFAKSKNDYQHVKETDPSLDLRIADRLFAV
jgi:hypothetical protein